MLAAQRIDFTRRYLRELERAGFVIIVYSLMFTSLVSFFAVMIIPDADRQNFLNNLIGGLAMYLIGPLWLRLLFHGFVVLVGTLILAGAVNTAIIGSNGVLNRVAEDGVMPDWFLKPHRRYGTTHRILYLILFLQLATIIYSGGDVIILPSVSEEEAKQKYPGGWKAPRPYLRIVAQPKN